jgi:hypothetical protein
MVELFGGPFGSQILYDRPYKEAIAIKDARIKRKIKENEEYEKEREKQAREHANAMKNRK